jgi:hypothetical protein
MTTLVEGKHPGGFLVWEALRDYTREVVTIASGTLEPGTVLGKITASGKYAAHDPEGNVWCFGTYRPAAATQPTAAGWGPQP